MIVIFFLMILCHILDDFVLQPVCLSNLKQKRWWDEHCYGKQYNNDYKMALLIHSLSWSNDSFTDYIFIVSIWIVTNIKYFD